jgi:cyclopropane-fatty-acyl-phospholipid synthase
MKSLKTYFQAELQKAGITINGTAPYDICVHNERVYWRVLSQGTLGLGEAYMDGWWDCEDLAGFFTRVIGTGVNREVPNVASKLLDFSQKFINAQDKRRAKRVGEQHYDLGNDLYEAMLDKRLVYTCGYWKDAKNLDEAQEHKLKLICEKLSLKPGQRILDVGCGWGSFAKYAAENYGVSVVGITISKEQVELGNELCKGLPVELRLLDYRDVKKAYPEPFDHIVSIGMFEHVGPKNYDVYFQTLREVLKPEGLFLLHTIGGNGADPWIEKYIFPGGVLPRMDQIISSAKQFIVEDWHNFGADYDRTLCAWYDNFIKAWPKLKATGKYSERFYRMWCYYLMCSAAAFRARQTQLWQVVLSPNGIPGGYKSIR